MSKKHLMVDEHLGQFLFFPQNLSILTPSWTHQGSVQNPLMSVNSSQKSSLYPLRKGPSSLVKINTKLSSQLINWQETEKAHTSISITSKTQYFLLNYFTPLFLGVTFQFSFNIPSLFQVETTANKRYFSGGGFFGKEQLRARSEHENCNYGSHQKT